MQDIQSIDGMKLIIDWDLRHQMAFVFEIDTELATTLIPRGSGLQPYEARPGVSLIFLGYNDYNPGNVIYGEKQPAFIEITRVLMVQPDLSVDMPIPRFTFLMHRIASNNPAFVKQEREVLRLNSYYSPSMRSELDEARTSVLIRDADGPMRELNNTHPRPVFRKDQFWGQYFTVQDNKLYFGVFYWAGRVCVHQRRGDAGGELAHPYLSGVDPTLPPGAMRNSYMQLLGTYGEPLVQRFYEQRFVRDL